MIYQIERENIYIVPQNINKHQDSIVSIPKQYLCHIKHHDLLYGCYACGLDLGW